MNVRRVSGWLALEMDARMQKVYGWKWRLLGEVGLKIFEWVGQGEIILFAKTQVSPVLNVKVGRNWNAGNTKVGIGIMCYTRRIAKHGCHKHLSVCCTIP